jgi:RNA polymerase sigma-70 factor (ECF subfamily)
MLKDSHIEDTKNEAAFNRLFLTYYQPLCRYAFHFVRSKELAEEIVDDAFYHLWEKFADVSKIKSIKAYLYMSVHNHCINELKSSSHQQSASTVSVYSNEGIDFLETVFSDGDYPLGYLLMGELDKQVRKSIDLLPDSCREIFLMSREKGMTYQAIAQQTGLSVNTVKYHIKNALGLLSKDLSKYMLLVLCAFF